MHVKLIDCSFFFIEVIYRAVCVFFHFSLSYVNSVVFVFQPAQVFFHEHQVVVGIAPAFTWLICILGPMRFTPRLPAFWHVQHNLNLI